MSKVLVADDNPGIRELIKLVLTAEGHDITEAVNGEWAYATAVSERPDLILLDVMMPVMDGFEALKRLRENPLTEAIPVVLLTAVPARKGERAGMKLGVTHYITKPFDSETVRSVVRVALREAAGKDVKDPGDTALPGWQSWAFQGRKSSVPESQRVIRTGKSP